jgi:thiamine biosynthesis lipoprotein
MFTNNITPRTLSPNAVKFHTRMYYISTQEPGLIQIRGKQARIACLAIPVLLLFTGCKSRYSSIGTAETHFFNNPVTLSLAVHDEEAVQAAIGLAMLEIRRIERMFDPVNPEGSLYRLNTDRSIRDPELYQLLERAYPLTELTSGGLNLFLGYLERAYGFDKLLPEPPDANTLREILLTLGRTKIEFDPSRYGITMPNDAFEISLSGLREGYMADQALAHLSMAGVQNAMVQVGSHFACGSSVSGLGWQVTIMNPVVEDSSVNLFVEFRGVSTASVRDQAYRYRDEIFYNHLDPETGRPASTLSSATVVAPTCELASSLARGVFVLPPEEGLRLLNELPAIEGLFINNDGRVAVSDSMFLWMGE